MSTAAQLQVPTYRVTAHLTALEVVARTEPGEPRDRRWADRNKLTDVQAGNLAQVAAAVEWVRGLVGRPVRVTSGFRAGDSKQHGDGSALDIQVDGMSPLELAWLIRRHASEMPSPSLRQVIAEARKTGLTGPMGQGTNRWVHVAVHSARWPSGRDWLETSDGSSYDALRAAGGNS